MILFRVMAAFSMCGILSLSFFLFSASVTACFSCPIDLLGWILQLYYESTFGLGPIFWLQETIPMLRSTLFRLQVSLRPVYQSLCFDWHSHKHSNPVTFSNCCILPAFHTSLWHRPFDPRCFNCVTSSRAPLRSWLSDSVLIFFQFL